jgi:hypothetical protein
MDVNDDLLGLLKECSTIHAHLDNDLFSKQAHWRAQRDLIARELADFYNREIYDGPEE